MRFRYPHAVIPLFSTMNTQTLSNSTPFSNLQKSLFLQTRFFQPKRPFFTVFCSKRASKFPPLPLKTNGYHGVSTAKVPRPVHLEENNVEMQFDILKKKLEVVGMDTEICVPGQHNHLLCPKCQGGDTIKKSLSIYIAPDGGSAAWVCFRGKCGWKGSTQAFADSNSYSKSMKKLKPPMKEKELKEEDLQLEPLCNELVAYFSERLISKETLQRNGVMQRKYDDQIVIAFTYRRNGALISCKYRDVNKRFWQEADTEKIFYGLDDIVGESDVIIVEGEMDKLAMEEAGFRNCISVPDGAPPSVSSKELPPLEQASRIILATDGDPPGQALAEELARCFGKEKLACFYIESRFCDMKRGYLVIGVCVYGEGHAEKEAVYIPMNV